MLERGKRADIYRRPMWSISLLWGSGIVNDVAWS